VKLSKPVRKLHEQARALLERGGLDDDEREFCYRNLRPDATTDIGKGSAFFTPWEIANDFQIETLNDIGRPKRVLDLCAGFGILSYMQHRRWCSSEKPEFVCVEINPEYVEIGKKLFPEAQWIRADVFDLAELKLGRFDEFYSNPPFGPVPAAYRNQYPKRRFEYAVAEIGMQHADTGTMIVQQGITDWKMSNQRGFSQHINPAYDAWKAVSGLRLANNCGIDCSHTPFAETNVTVDIALVERA